MPRSTIIFLLILTILAGLLGYNYFVQPFDFTQESVEVSIEAPVSELVVVPSVLDQLTTRQQLAQLIAFPYLVTAQESSTSAALTWIEQHQPGMVVLFGEKIASSSAQTAVEKIKNVAADLQPLIAVDHEGGTVQRLRGTGFTRLPSWQSLCADNKQARQDLLAQSAQELAQVGINIVFAPVVDVASRSGSLASRACDSDPEVVVARAQEFIEVFSQAKIMPVIKHFPGIGSLGVDLHRRFGEISLTQEEVGVFQFLLAEYPHIGVMTTHVGIKDLFEDKPCSLNPACLSDLVEYFPETLVISDALDMQATGEESLASRSAAALRAGNDVLVYGPHTSGADLEGVISQLEILFNNDLEFKARVQQSVKKIWEYNRQKVIVKVGDSPPLAVEVAKTTEAIAQGLSGRDEIGADGMLFMFSESIPQFWMKEMRFGLDLVWIKDMEVVAITKQVPAPQNTDAELPRYSPEKPVDMVLEINEGKTQEWGVEVGDLVVIEKSKKR